MNEKLDALIGGLCFVALFLLLNFLPELMR
jgi:hypothetical protein